MDNGNTLEPLQEESLRIIHNPNYGGSGGFTRGIIERVEENKVDYIILMDDDVNVDTTAMERTHALVCGLKKQYKDSFIAGAMLDMDKPFIQHENMAYWQKIKSHVIGNGLDLSSLASLCSNEKLADYTNQYAGWWFCGIPLKRIQKIGYPLPNFIKGDDMEYGIRNAKPILRMNGIAVWHEAFAKKMTSFICYFSDRNMFIMNQYASDCNGFTLFVAILGRVVKRLFQRNFDGIRFLNLAIDDFFGGYEYITAIPGDKKFASVRNYKDDRNILIVIFSIMKKAGYGMLNYRRLKRQYETFRSKKLSDSRFWKAYLYEK